MTATVNMAGSSELNPELLSVQPTSGWTSDTNEVRSRNHDQKTMELLFCVWLYGMHMSIHVHMYLGTRHFTVEEITHSMLCWKWDPRHSGPQSTLNRGTGISILRVAPSSCCQASSYKQTRGLPACWLLKTRGVHHGVQLRYPTQKRTTDLNGLGNR